MSSRKHRAAENIENQCPVARKRSTSKSSTVSAVGGTVGGVVVVGKSTIYEHASSPSVLTYETLEEMGIGMLDSEESSSSAMSAIALAVSGTSDENSNETTPSTSVARMMHPQMRMSLNSTASTLDNTNGSISIGSNNNTVIEVFNDDTILHPLSQSKRSVLSSSECGSNSNSPSKRTRNPLATVTCNNQTEAQAPSQVLLPPPPQQTPQTPLSLLPSTSKQAFMRQQKKINLAGAVVKRQLTSDDLDDFFVYRTAAMTAHANTGINYFDKLSDELLLYIFRFLPKKALQRIASVCRRFNRCAGDESLWPRLNLGSRTLRPYALEHVVRRGVPVLRLAQAEIQDPAFTYEPSDIPFETRLQYLDLTLATISQDALHTLMCQCRQLRKLSLEHVEVNDDICYEISQNASLETLNLSMSSGFTAIGICNLLDPLNKLHSLNISWTELDVSAVTALVLHITPNIIRLNIAGCRKVLFDAHVATLQKRCPQLLELDLSDCNSLTPTALETIMCFSSLEYLSLSRCYLIPATNFVELKHMSSLTYLDIFGMLSEAAMEVLEKQMPKIGINKFIHSSVSRPTVGSRRTSIWGLKTRD